MVKGPVRDKEPIIWGCSDGPYRETGMDSESYHLCGGLFVFKNKKMETFIIILLIVVALELYDLIRGIRHLEDLIKRISLGLFPIPNGGLDKLVYLELIHDQIEKMIKEKTAK
jgi:hypothetical protein